MVCVCVGRDAASTIPVAESGVVAYWWQHRSMVCVCVLVGMQLQQYL